MQAWLSMGMRHPRRLSGRMAEHDLRLFLSVGQQHHRLPDPQFAGCGRRCAAAEPGAFRRGWSCTTGFISRCGGFRAVGWLFYVDSVVWVFLLLLAALVLRDGLRAAVPYMFFFGTLGICSLPKSGEIRYLMPILYILPVMLGAALLPRARRKSHENRRRSADVLLPQRWRLCSA